jgi:hypothetical protein
VFVCGEIFRDESPVLLVSHETDGDWQFLCGKVHAEDAAQVHLVGLNHLLERDPSLMELRDLVRGSEAGRNALGSVWTRRPILD